MAKRASELSETVELLRLLRKSADYAKLSSRACEDALVNAGKFYAELKARLDRIDPPPPEFKRGTTPDEPLRCVFYGCAGHLRVLASANGGVLLCECDMCGTTAVVNDRGRR